jgi:hypothetical protein
MTSYCVINKLLGGAWVRARATYATVAEAEAERRMMLSMEYMGAPLYATHDVRSVEVSGDASARWDTVYGSIAY